MSTRIGAGSWVSYSTNAWWEVIVRLGDTKGDRSLVNECEPGPRHLECLILTARLHRSRKCHWSPITFVPELKKRLVQMFVLMCGKVTSRWRRISKSYWNINFYLKKIIGRTLFLLVWKEGTQFDVLFMHPLPHHHRRRLGWQMKLELIVISSPMHRCLCKEKEEEKWITMKISCHSTYVVPRIFGQTYL